MRQPVKQSGLGEKPIEGLYSQYSGWMDFFCSQGKLSEAEFQLTGSEAYAARFGETVVDLGDLDDDGYPGKDHSNTARQLTFNVHTKAIQQHIRPTRLKASMKAFLRFLRPLTLFSEENHCSLALWEDLLQYSSSAALLQYLVGHWLLLRQSKTQEICIYCSAKPSSTTSLHLQRQHQ